MGKFDENNDIILSVLAKSKASFVVFPELCLSSYTAGDFFFENDFNNNILKSLDYIIKKTSFKGVYILGMPLVWQEMIFNVAIVIQQQKILGIVPKYTIPNYEEFCEKRWFTSGNVIPEMLIWVSLTIKLLKFRRLITCRHLQTIDSLSIWLGICERWFGRNIVLVFNGFRN
ncbi:MAG: hypothetical protein Q8772_02415, partial [Candidatus Phytoplasma australasiaticum]|nr:hypothetical protein [Candidatus Phytoplasma australasiaticum]